MDEQNTDNVDNPETASSAGAGATPAAAAGREAANEAKAEMERTYSQIKGAGIAGIFGFKAFYFPIVARVLWIVALVLLILFAVGMIIKGFSDSIVAGIVSLILVPLVALIYAVMIRIWFEVAMVLFRINDGIQEMCRKMK